MKFTYIYIMFIFQMLSMNLLGNSHIPTKCIALGTWDNPGTLFLGHTSLPALSKHNDNFIGQNKCSGYCSEKNKLGDSILKLILP